MQRFWILLLGILLAACTTGGTASPPKINSFSATPSSLPAGGGSVQLDWDVSGATSLSISGGVGSVSPVDKGSKTINVTASQSFTLTAIAGTLSASKEVSVTVAPSISISPVSRAFVAGDTGASFDALVQGSTGTVNWVLSGPGNLSSSSGSSIIYTPPPSIATLGKATLTASVSGTALSASAEISVAPTVLTGGVLFYKTDGSGTLNTLANTGEMSLVKTYTPSELPSGITHFGKPYELYELLYSAADGSGALGSFDGAGVFRKLRTYAAGDLPVGQTHLVSLNDRLVFYKAGTTICGSYGNNYDFSNPVTQTGFANNWNLFVRVNDANGVHFYRQSDGVGAYGTYNATCKWSYLLALPGYSTNWSFTVRTANGVLFYRKSDGAGALVTYAANGAPTQTGTYLGKLAKDWEQIINTKSGVLFYKSDGSGELATFSGNTYTKVKSYAAGDLPANANLVAAVGN